jgi:hypothetical protein
VQRTVNRRIIAGKTGRGAADDIDARRQAMRFFALGLPKAARI